MKIFQLILGYMTGFSLFLAIPLIILYLKLTEEKRLLRDFGGSFNLIN